MGSRRCRCPAADWRIRTISPDVYVDVLAVGCFVIALWISARWPRLEPQDWRVLGAHVGASLLLADLLIPVGLSLGERSPLAMLGALVVFVIPTITYALLAGVWVIRVATRMMSAYH